MVKRAAPPGSLAPPPAWSGGQQTAVRAQLARIAESAVLHHSPRLQRLLRHIVEATLNGEVDRLKGYTVGVEVFDRAADWDPNLDPIVRVEMGRLRSKLFEYYAGEGRRDEVRIELPKGGLAARIGFRVDQLTSAQDESGVSPAASAGPAPTLANRSPPHNLPQPLTSFIGRDHELKEVTALLEEHRLLTLIGIGGIGKTRLALQVAAGIVERYPDGVWLAELGAIADPGLVATAVARTLSVQEPPQAPLTKTLCTYLKSRRLLLILDNCEHLIEACAELTRALLNAAPHLRVLATSREPLAIDGEQVFALPPLSLPVDGTGVQTIAEADAVRLFIDRARLRQPGFGFGEQQGAQAVAQLCTHLDGIPLALELAAARIGALSVDDINARLKDRFRLLTTGMRTAEPRQQTLRATLDWSYELLADSERETLRRLSVFSGGFTIEAAAFVVPLATTHEVDVIDLLSRLVARSLLVADSTESSTRYRLLETTRAYALEKLAQAGETAPAEERHAQYFRRRFERAHDDWMQLPTAVWRARYLPELEDVRGALDWAASPHGDDTLGFGLASATGPLWIELALRAEGRRRLGQAAEALPSPAQALERARLSLWLGILWDEVAPARSQALHERAVELYRVTDDASGLSFALVQLAFALVHAGQYERAPAVLEQASEALQHAAQPRALARHAEVLGLLAHATRNLDSARTHLERSLSLYRSMDAEREVLRTLGNLADLRWALGDLDAAESGYREAVAARRQSTVANKGMLGFALCGLAGVLVERGQLDEALACAREGLPILKDLDLAWFNMDHFALRTALVGSFANAARVAGYLDAVLRSKAPRGPNEARANERLKRILRERIDARELEDLLAEGAILSEDNACRIVLER